MNMESFYWKLIANNNTFNFTEFEVVEKKTDSI